MKFLITNMEGFKNKGFEAVTKVIINEIKNRFPSAEFTIFSDDPEYDSLWISSGSFVKFLPTPSTQPNFIKQIDHFFKKKDTLNSLNENGENSFRTADIVITIGGDIFCLGHRYLKINLRQLEPAIKLKKKIMLIAHSIGPFKLEREAWTFKKYAKNFSMITLRESLSFKYLQKMNIPKVILQLTADPAFLLPAIDKELIQKLFLSYKLSREKVMVGVCVNQGMHTYRYSKISYDYHLDVLIKFIRYLLARQDVHIMLIPHAAERYIKKDDTMLCEQIHRALNFTDNITSISLNHSAEEIKGLIGCCELLISERMHAAIAGLSQNIPTLVIGHNVKNEGILNDIYGVNEVNNFLINVNKIDESILIKNFENIFSKKENVKKFLERAIPAIKGKARDNFSLVENLIKDIN